MRVQTRQVHHVTLLSVVQKILADPSCDLEETLLGFSRDHFNRFFRDAMGESLYEFARRIRLERAAQRLREGIPPCSAAIEAGFTTSEAFAKAFRSEFGVAPRAYAKGDVANTSINPSRAHWGDERAPLSIDPATRFGAGLVTRQTLRIAAMQVQGDYVNIPDAWESLANDISEEDRRFNTWITVFHSDGMRKAGRQQMSARLGHVFLGGELRPGFSLFTVPGGSYVVSSVVNGREEHSEAWTLFNKLWIPKSGPRPMDYPAFDIYDHFPTPFSDLKATIHLRLE